MTEPNTNRRSDTTGNDSTANASYTFKIQDATDIAVYLYQASTGEQLADPLDPGDYTVNGPFNDDAGGTITITNATYLSGSGFIPTDDVVTIIGARAASQTTGFKNQARYYPARHEDAFDKETVIAQQLQEQLDRALVLEETNQETNGKVPAPVASSFLYRTAAGLYAWVTALSLGALIFPVTTTINAVMRWGAVDGTQAKDSGIIIDDSDNIIGINDIRIDGAFIDDNGNELLDFSYAASAVNYLRIINHATGSKPQLSATGGDSDIDLALSGKNNGDVYLTSGLNAAGGLAAALLLSNQQIRAATGGNAEIKLGDSAGATFFIVEDQGGTTQFQVDSDGKVDIEGTADASTTLDGSLQTDGGLSVVKSAVIGNLLDLSNASAGQIKFPATQNPSADANTLDDYEEGTFTPVLVDNSQDTGEGQTYNIQVGRYTRIGRVVHFSLWLSMSSVGTLSGSAYIAGLPFSANGLTNFNQSCHCSYGNNLNSTAGYNVSGYILAGNDYISLSHWDLSDGTSQMQVSDITGTGVLAFSGSYEI